VEFSLAKLVHNRHFTWVSGDEITMGWAWDYKRYKATNITGHHLAVNEGIWRNLARHGG